jgi:hypothetical protein
MGGRDGWFIKGNFLFIPYVFPMHYMNPLKSTSINTTMGDLARPHVTIPVYLKGLGFTSMV